jgi:hypothetical protein
VQLIFITSIGKFTEQSFITVSTKCFKYCGILFHALRFVVGGFNLVHKRATKHNLKHDL